MQVLRKLYVCMSEIETIVLIKHKWISIIIHHLCLWSDRKWYFVTNFLYLSLFRLPHWWQIIYYITLFLLLYILYCIAAVIKNELEQGKFRIVSSSTFRSSPYNITLLSTIAFSVSSMSQLAFVWIWRQFADRNTCLIWIRYAMK